MSSDELQQFRRLEDSVLNYFDHDPRKQQHLHDLLDECGLFDFITAGIIRILVEKVPPDNQLRFLKEHIRRAIAQNRASLRLENVPDQRSL